MNIYDELCANDKEKVYIHNEIFQELRDNKYFTGKNAVFIYGYYCLVAYLFRYCKYGNKLFNNEDIKEMLGYKRKYAGVDYLIKKGGVLDQIGFMDSIRDYPIQYKQEDGFVEFDMYSEQDDAFKKSAALPRTYYIKKPLKAFYRSAESQNDNVYDGTFYDISDTHLFDVNVFVDMMRNGLSLNEFYVYQYLKHKNDLFKSGYDTTYEQMERKLKLSARTLKRVTLNLEEHGYIEITRDHPKGKDTKPNVYKVKK